MADDSYVPRPIDPSTDPLPTDLEQFVSPTTRPPKEASAETLAWVEALRKEPKRDSFDMDDAPELERLKQLPADTGAKARMALQFLQEQVYQRYQDFDAAAMRNQWRHKLTARIAIWGGIIAIVLAVVQLVAHCLAHVEHPFDVPKKETTSEHTSPGHGQEPDQEQEHKDHQPADAIPPAPPAIVATPAAAPPATSTTPDASTAAQAAPAPPEAEATAPAKPNNPDHADRTAPAQPGHGQVANPSASSFGKLCALLEAFAMVVTIIAVAFGLLGKYKPQWLANRLKAERLRMLKFVSLTFPELGKPEAWQKLVNEEIAKIEKVNAENVKEWHEISEVLVPTLADLEEANLSGDDLKVITALYEIKRLRMQQNYFAGKLGSTDHTADTAAKPKSKEESLWKFTVIIFWATAIIVLLHVLAESLFLHRVPPAYEFILVGLAAVLPVIGFGYRSVQAAFETPRSRALFAAKAHALNTYLETAEKAAVKREAAIQDMALAEKTFFMNEHREWQRLLLDAEWF